MVDVHNTLVITAIRKWGSKEQQKKYLPSLATNVLGAFCLSGALSAQASPPSYSPSAEWGSGSDAFAMKTKAVRTRYTNWHGL